MIHSLKTSPPPPANPPLKRISRIVALLCSLVALLYICEPESHAQTAASLSYAKVNPMVLAHRRTDSLAMGARNGDAVSIHVLSQTVFLRAGVPASVAYASAYVQRLAQAETDYRNGGRTPLHIEDVVRANNDFVRILGAPQWALTDPLEVTRLRMGLFARYPQLFVTQTPTKVHEHFQILSLNLSPVEAAFLATSLLYQKEFNPEYQLTNTERENSLSSPFPSSFYQIRTREFADMLHGSATDLSLSSLAQAAEILLGDLNISSSLRPEFQSMFYVNPTMTGKAGQ